MGELGSLLTSARAARGLSLEDAERDTRISRRYLAALEAEQFDVIPAPVYARGFLRSYSQYLGLDPQEALALFPRDEAPSPYYAGTGQSPASPRPQQPAAVGAARPSWRRPAQQTQPQRAAPRRAEAPRERPGPGDPGWEPTIGVDLGVPAPARRLKTDPAAQTRSMTVLVVAIAAIAAVLLLAMAISRLGGDSDNPGAILGGDATTTATAAGEATAEQQTPIIGGVEVTPGVMPDVVGMTEELARQALVAAGFPETGITTTTNTHPEPAGIVFDQQPIPGSQILEGDQAIIAVSLGP